MGTRPSPTRRATSLARAPAAYLRMTTNTADLPIVLVLPGLATLLLWRRNGQRAADPRASAAAPYSSAEPGTARSAAWKPSLEWVPSQNGFLVDAPQGAGAPVSVRGGGVRARPRAPPPPAAWKPRLEWVPSQNGFLVGAPQRQSATVSLAG